jgi:hypothetical protein
VLKITANEFISETNFAMGCGISRYVKPLHSNGLALMIGPSEYCTKPTWRSEW